MPHGPFDYPPSHWIDEGIDCLVPVSKAMILAIWQLGHFESTTAQSTQPSLPEPCPPIGTALDLLEGRLHPIRRATEAIQNIK
jgi:hypothetical protein